MLLGSGLEGTVTRVGDTVEKRFYPGAMDPATAAWLERALRGVMPHLPEPLWYGGGDEWTIRYPWFPTDPVNEVGVEEGREFLLFCLRKRLVCANVKRANFRRHPGGGLVFVDVGRAIVPMDVSWFRDSAARMYAVSALGWTDERLWAESGSLRTEAGLATLDGFGEFYRDLLSRHAERAWSAAPVRADPARLPPADGVTLLVKACAMDAAFLPEQVAHLVAQLSRPRAFAERILLIDPFRGPFLRQHAEGDLDLLLAAAKGARERGWVDRVLVAPDDSTAVAEVNARWFGLRSDRTHTPSGVPVAPQLWGLEQVRTRWVLQCDADVLVGRRDPSHDYLGEMLDAARADDVLGVAFNIPHPPDSPSRPYDAPPGEYVPEVRCGLLDLERVARCRPLPNELDGGAPALSWYRSLQRHQHGHGLRTVRGGDPRSFYLHPPNTWKGDAEALARVRDLVGQGRVPARQHGRWDLEGTADDWRYAPRSEGIVFLLKGRDTPPERVRRCVASLAMQDDGDFGVVVIDDASAEPDAAFLLPHRLASLGDRVTLVRRSAHRGRIPNFILGIREICTDPETVVVILDLDDALVDRSAVRRLREARDAGCDVVLGSMFRPDKPLKLYRPDFAAPREHWGGDVWIHLRAFRKRLFDAIPDDALKLDGGWIEHCTDYATMIPIVELCRRPAYIAEYLYFHERSTPRTAALRAEKDTLIRRILAKPRLD